MSNTEIATAVNVAVDAATPSATTTPAATTTEGTPSTPDICDQTPVSATEVCNMLATAEGNGTYIQTNGSTGASGRYQFMTQTAIGVIAEVRPVSNTAEARTIWDNCKSSSTEDCKKLQDEMCENYSAYIARSLNNSKIPLTDANRYLAWNQGTGGSRAIHRSMTSGQDVTNPTILKNMKGQAWDFSPDGQTFYNNMLEHLNERGVALA